MRIVLANGQVIDGTSHPRREADVLITDSRITAVEPSLAPLDAAYIDCRGLVVAPGFIDAHSHSDLRVLANPVEKVRQGVTTEVVGNCGFSAFPCASRAAEVREFANGIFCGDDAWAWPSAADYLVALRDLPAANVFSLVGHGSLRVAHSGMAQGRLEPADLALMEGTLIDSLAAGAVGFSTGLMYAPGSGAPFDELERLCSTVAACGGIYCTHMRSYSWDLLDSIDEQIRLARASQCRLQISHLQAVGRANWDKQEQALEAIEQARGSGVDVEFDSYPYLAGSTVLQQLVPQEWLEGGISAFLSRLTSLSVRREVVREINEETAQSWSDILIAGVGSRQNRSLVGLNLANIAESRGTEPAAAVLDLLAEEHGQVTMLSFNQSESNLRALLSHPLCTVISDGFYVKGRPHPRLFGTFPELLGKCSREKGWLSMEEAIHKITAKPAARFGLKDRGTLRSGAFADVTVFDPNTIGSPATYENPERSPHGIMLVLKEGNEIFRDRTPGIAESRLI